MLGACLSGCGSSGSTPAAKRSSPAAKRSSPAAEKKRDPAPHSEIALGKRLRKTYVAELEAAILADARLLVKSHLLRGPILGVSCTPMERGGQPIAAGTLHFNCMAINRRVESATCTCRGTSEGARFFGSVDLETGEHSYQGR